MFPFSITESTFHYTTIFLLHLSVRALAAGVFNKYLLAKTQSFSIRFHKEIDGEIVPARIIAGGDYFFFRTKRGRLFEGRRLFQILLTGSKS